MAELTIRLGDSFDSNPYYQGDDVVIPFEVTLGEDQNMSEMTVELHKDTDGNQVFEKVEGVTLVDDSGSALTNSFRITNAPLSTAETNYRLKVFKTDDSASVNAESTDFHITVEANTASFNVGDIQVVKSDNQLTFTVAVNSVHNDLVYEWKKVTNSGSEVLGSSASVTVDRVEYSDIEEIPRIELTLKANNRRGTYRLTKTLNRQIELDEYRKDPPPAPPEEEAEERTEDSSSGTETATVSGASDSETESREDYAAATEEQYLETHYTNASPSTIVSVAGRAVTMGIQPTKQLPESARVDFSWEKDGSSTVYTTSSIQLSSPTEQDSGTYILHVVLTTPKQQEQRKDYTFNLTVTRSEEPSGVEDTRDEEEASDEQLNLSETNLGIVHENDLITLNAINVPQDATLAWYGIDINGEHQLIDGQTTDRLQVRATPSMARAIYVKATKGIVETTSPEAIIATFTPAPINVVSENVTKNVSERESVTYSIEVTPKDNYTSIRWYHENLRGDSTEVIGATNQTILNIDPVTQADAGRYYAVVSRLTSTQVRSRILTLNVTPIEQPIDFNISLDKSGRIQVPAGGVFTLVATVYNTTEHTSYQWVKKTDSGTTLVRGQNTKVLTLDNVSDDDSGHYQLVVTQGQSEDTSDWVYLDVIEQASAEVEDISLPSETGVGEKPSDEITIRNKTYPIEVSEFATFLNRYVDAMYVGTRVELNDGILWQTSLFRVLLKVLNIKDHAIYMRAMDLVVDYFYAYRTTVFDISLRARFIDKISEEYMSRDEKEAFQTLLPVFAYMADPENNTPQALREVSDVVVDQMAWARFGEYFDRKIETNRHAILTDSEQWLAERSSVAGSDLYR